MLSSFDIIAGSTPGRNHLKAMNNNQDAYLAEVTDNYILGLVCDGCGSAKSSEVGARLGSYLTRAAILENVVYGTDFVMWDHVCSSLDHKITQVASMSKEKDHILTEMFLFTIVGFIILPKNTFTFHMGDGLTIVNGIEQRHQTISGNFPSYFAYRLVNTTMEIPEEFKVFSVKEYKTDEIGSILVGTDGMFDYIDLADRIVPGTGKPIGPVSDLWSSEQLFYNKQMLDRKLHMINKERCNLERTSLNPPIYDLKREPPILQDDTTAVVLRRKPSCE